MKKITILSIFLILLTGSFSCTNIDIKAEKKQSKIEQLYNKYKDMIKKQPDCAPCVDCATLALSIKYDNKQEISKYKQKLTEYYKTNDSIPCPELLEEIKVINY